MHEITSWWCTTTQSEVDAWSSTPACAAERHALRAARAFLTDKKLHCFVEDANVSQGIAPVTAVPLDEFAGHALVGPCRQCSLKYASQKEKPVPVAAPLEKPVGRCSRVPRCSRGSSSGGVTLRGHVESVHTFWRTPGLPIFEPMAEPRPKKRAARRSHFRDRLQCFSQWWAPKTGPVFLSRVPPIRARRPPYGSGATTPRHLWYILRRRDTLGEQCPAA